MQKELHTIHSFGGTVMRKLLGALLLAASAACSNNDSTTAPASGAVSGNFALRTANGTAVPTVATEDQTGKYEVLSGRVILRSDLSFVDSLTARFTPAGGTVQSLVDVREGFYTQTGNNITLTFATSQGVVHYAMTWMDANTLAYSEPELSLIYQR
jgi:hypothetical protein